MSTPEDRETRSTSARYFRRYRNLIACTPLPLGVERLTATINAIQTNRPLPHFANQPALPELPDVRLLGIHEWGLETLTRDVMAYGGLYGTRDLYDWNHLADLINTLNALENEIYAEDPNKDIIYYELFRIGHRQFGWQDRVTNRDLARYLNLYEYPPLASVLNDAFGLSAAEIYRLLLALLSLFDSSRLVRLPISFEGAQVSSDGADILLSRITTDFADLTLRSITDSVPDSDFAYRPSALREKPLVKIEGQDGSALYCPIYRFLVDRLTDGLFFDLVGRKDFSNPFGFGFQHVVSRAARTLESAGYSIAEESEYASGTNRKDSIDLILSDSTADLFVECKSRRVSLSAKVNLSASGIEAEMDKAVASLVQSYTCIADGLAGRFAHWKPRSMPSYLVIVTLRPWYINSPRLRDYILSQTKVGLQTAGLPVSLINEAPYTLCSCDDFEELVCVLREVPIDRVFGDKTEPDLAGWDLGAYLSAHHKAELGRNRGAWHSLYAAAEAAIQIDMRRDTYPNQ